MLYETNVISLNSYSHSLFVRTYQKKKKINSYRVYKSFKKLLTLYLNTPLDIKKKNHKDVPQINLLIKVVIFDQK
jgi:hypothetical protein